MGRLCFLSFLTTSTTRTRLPACRQVPRRLSALPRSAARPPRCSAPLPPRQAQCERPVGLHKRLYVDAPLDAEAECRRLEP